MDVQARDLASCDLIVERPLQFRIILFNPASFFWAPDMTHSHRKLLLLGLLLGSLTTVTSDSWGDEPASFEKIGAQYDAQIRPLLKTYCLGCHSTEEVEGDLDLEKLKTLTDARRCAAGSRAEDGCERFEVYHSETDPQKFLLVEWWRSRADWEIHRTRQTVTEIFVLQLLPLVTPDRHICSLVE